MTHSVTQYLTSCFSDQSASRTETCTVKWAESNPGCQCFCCVLLRVFLVQFVTVFHCFLHSHPPLDIERVFWGKSHLPLIGLLLIALAWICDAHLSALVSLVLSLYGRLFEQRIVCVFRKFRRALWTSEQQRTVPAIQKIKTRTDTSTF